MEREPYFTTKSLVIKSSDQNEHLIPKREPYFTTKSLVIAVYLKQKGGRYLSATSVNNEHTFYFLDTPDLRKHLEELKIEVSKV